MNPTTFQDWVANTVEDCGGSYDECLCYLQREWALTCDVDRMNACQGGFDIYFNLENADSTPVFTIAPTNLRYFH